MRLEPVVVEQRKYQDAKKSDKFVVNTAYAEEGRKWADVHGCFLLEALKERNLSQTETREVIPLQSWAIAKMVHAMVQDGSIVVGKRHRGAQSTIWEYRLATNPLGTRDVGKMPEPRVPDELLPKFKVDEDLAEKGFAPTRNPDYDMAQDCGWDEHPDADGPMPEEWSGPGLFAQYSPALKTHFRRQKCLTFLEIKQYLEKSYGKNLHTMVVNKVLHAMADARLIWAVRCRDTGSRQYWSYYWLDSDSVVEAPWELNPRFVHEAKTKFDKGYCSLAGSFMENFEPNLPKTGSAMTLSQLIKALALTHKNQAVYVGTLLTHYLVDGGLLKVGHRSGEAVFSQA